MKPRKISILGSIATISLNTYAQSNKPLTAIFKQSYEYEAIRNLRPL